jgi:hypothetical protein
MRYLAYGQLVGATRNVGPNVCCGSKLYENAAERRTRRIVFQLSCSDRSYQCKFLSHRRNRDGISTRKLHVRVFTQPGAHTGPPPPIWYVRSALVKVAGLCTFEDARNIGAGPLPAAFSVLAITIRLPAAAASRLSYIVGMEWRAPSVERHRCSTYA